MTRTDTIRLLHESGFNCFPVPAGEKAADDRYKAATTLPNQTISDDENYGYVPIHGMGTCILDLDDKERFRPFVEKLMVNGVKAVETPNGWHVPIVNVGGNITKIELFDYRQQNKKIVEIQGSRHYCIGPGSTVDGREYVIVNEDDPF